MSNKNWRNKFYRVLMSTDLDKFEFPKQVGRSVSGSVSLLLNNKRDRKHKLESTQSVNIPDLNARCNFVLVIFEKFCSATKFK